MNTHFEAIRKSAEKYKLSAYLVAGFVMTESAGNPLAMRYEDHWPYFVTPEFFARKWGISVATEKQAQKHSWGLMQVMGGVARELGFIGQLPELLKPEIGLDLGCRKVSQLIKRYGDTDKAIAAYNAGSPRDLNGDGIVDNQSYVDKVRYFQERMIESFAHDH